MKEKIKGLLLCLVIAVPAWLLGRKFAVVGGPVISILLGMIVGTAVCYAFGTAWFCISASYTVGAALTVCVIPFIPADLIKMVIAMLLGPEIKKRIR